MVCSYFWPGVLSAPCLLFRARGILFSITYLTTPVDQARYATSIVAKYLDTDTVKKSTNFYKTTFPSDMIFTKDNIYTRDEQIDNLTREVNIHYRACILPFIYLLSTRVDLSFHYTSQKCFHKILVK